MRELRYNYIRTDHLKSENILVRLEYPRFFKCEKCKTATFIKKTRKLTTEQYDDYSCFRCKSNLSELRDNNKIYVNV